MTQTYQFRPLGDWPGPATAAAARKQPKFKTGYEATLDLLFAEAGKIGGRHLVLQVDLQERDIRNDGLPRSNARYGSHPGVIVSFESAYGPLRYLTDVYTTWKGNLRAIALSLEALRAVDRYGVSKRGEQYTGWRALPSASAPAFSSAEEARQWIRQQLRIRGSELGHSGTSTPREEYRALTRHLHPDVGGDPDAWALLDAARNLLVTAGQL